MVVIAISGLPGAGTSTIAKLLAKKLKLKYFSPGEYFKSHSKARTQMEQAKEVFESGKGKQKDFHEKIDKMQIELAKKGNIVICGKLSILMLKDLADYKIWIDCSFNERARRAAERDQIDLKQMKKMLKEREEIEKKEWIKDYGFDREKQREMADVVIDSSKLNEEETLEKILKLINL